MARLTLSFEMPDERAEAMTALHGASAALALNAIAQHLRTLDKYVDGDTVNIAELCEAVTGIMADHGFDAWGFGWWEA
jgi:hypothetical protein